jgi:3-methyladenine DNA glycosylase/8-oxoguanine DNA glycosylase
MTEQELELSPEAPFNFDATMHKPDHFPSGDNQWQPGVRWQTMLWKGKALGLKLENRGATEEPKILLTIWSQERLSRDFTDVLAEEISYRCNLQLGLFEFNRKFSDDPRLSPIIKRWQGMRPANYGSLYEYLVIAIVLQNATVRRSVAMMQALFERFGTRLSYDDKELFCFWQPESLRLVPEQELRDLKVGYRAKSILRVSEALAKREIDEYRLRSGTIDQQREALLGIYGIGPASVGYILFDVFHQWNELSHISPWEQKIYSKLFFDTGPDDPKSVKELKEYFERHFGGYKMLAVHYIWEDLFWRRQNESIPWLEKLIRL